jgi:hypothetical protein
MVFAGGGMASRVGHELFADLGSDGVEAPT